MADEKGQGQEQGSETPPATWSDFIKAHPEAQPLHEAETASLRSALDKERDKAKTAEKSYRVLAKTADPETAEKLRKLADETKAEAEQLKAQLDFTSTAVRLGCRAVDKAWTIATATGMTAEEMKTDPDWSALFAEPKPANANAGAGTDRKSTPFKQRMNDALRQAAGYPTS